MARPRNRVPSYLHHKASGQAFVRINGRDIYLGRYDSKESKEKFARLIAEHFQNGNSRTIVVPDGDELTVAALAVKYDDHAQSYYRKNGEPTDHLAGRKGRQKRGRKGVRNRFVTKACTFS